MPANDFTIVKNESGAIAKFRFTEQGKYNFVRWFNTNADPVEASIDFFEEEILIELHGMYREKSHPLAQQIRQMVDNMPPVKTERQIMKEELKQKFRQYPEKGKERDSRAATVPLSRQKDRDRER